MLIAYRELIELVNEGVINSPLENVNQTSIDVVIGDKIIREAFAPNQNASIVRPVQKQSFTPEGLAIPEDGYIMEPGEFILAQTKEIFNLPNNISAEFKLKSSIARAGLNHCLAGWCDPGWNGSTLTLELKNELTAHRILLERGMKIGQIIFFRHEEVPPDHSYAVKGMYNGTTETTASKGV